MEHAHQAAVFERLAEAEEIADAPSGSPAKRRAT